jgi:hypothetical protein
MLDTEPNQTEATVTRATRAEWISGVALLGSVLSDRA